MYLTRVGNPVVLQRAELVGARADLLRGRMRLTLDLLLDDDSLALRTRLAAMATDADESKPVEVTLQQMRFKAQNFQLTIFGRGEKNPDATLAEQADPKTGELPRHDNPAPPPRTRPMPTTLTHRQTASNMAAQLLALRPVFLDTETTGLSTDAQICDLALIDTDGALLFSELLRPTVPIERGAQAVHGISAELVAGARTLAQAWPQLVTQFGSRHLVAYNIAFDLRLITQSLRAPGMPPTLANPRHHCAMTLYATFAGVPGRYGCGYRWHSLAAAAYQCGLVVPPDLHRATADAELCRRLVFYMAAYAPAYPASAPT